MTTKNNPLFVDSTKFHGDSIGTQVELKNVAVFEGEDLFIVIINHQGISLRILMSAMDERTYEARLHLNHQKMISYHFVIEKEGQEILRSTPRKGRAQYAIIEEWLPELSAEDAQRLSPPVDLAASDESDVSWTKEASSSVKSLIDKWGF